MALLQRIRKLSAGRRGHAGETIVEVLVAMTVACLAMVMLVMAISSSSSILQQGKAASDSYYGSTERLVTVDKDSGSAGAVKVTPDFKETGSTPDPASVPVTYDHEDLPGGGSAIAYQSDGSLAEG